MNIEVVKELFNIFSPAYIYFRADVTFKNAANKALKKMRAFFRGRNQEFCDYVRSVAKPIDGCDELFGLMTRAYGIDRFDVCQDTLRLVYNDLFERICKEVLGDGCEFGFDKYGAFEVNDADGNFIFSGDDYQTFPYYADAGLLVDRLLKGAA